MEQSNDRSFAGLQYMELVGDVKMNRISLPIGSMYGIFIHICTYIYHNNQLSKRSANMAYMDPMGFVCVCGVQMILDTLGKNRKADAQ